MPIVRTAPPKTNWAAGWGSNPTYLPALMPPALMLGAGWYFDWNVTVNVPRTPGLEYVQCVNVNANGPMQGAAHIQAAARANPGMTWLLGNEVDCADQNGMSPEAYARVYHDLRQVILDADWAANIATGSVAQFTPTRRAWLERWIAESIRLYRQPPVCDVWNTHAYMWPEGDNSIVGVSRAGWTWSVEDHASVDAFASQLRELRWWLDNVGYRGTPIWVSEFGVLWDTVSAVNVRAFLRGAVEWLRGSGVVQRWAWFALHQVGGFNPALALATEQGLTETGRLFADSVRG